MVFPKALDPCFAFCTLSHSSLCNAYHHGHGHHLSIIVMLCWVKIRQWRLIVHHLVAMLLTWHLVLGLANSKGEGGLTSSLFILWWPHCWLWHVNSGSHCCCLMLMWPVIWLVTWHCHVGHPVMVVGNQRGGWWALWVAVSKRQRWWWCGGAWVLWMMVVVEEQEKDGWMMGRIPTHGICHNPF